MSVSCTVLHPPGETCSWERTPRTVTIVIPGRPPNPNRTRRYHWRVRHRSDREWRTAARVHALHVLGREWSGPMTRARLEVIHVVPTKARRDPDNLAAGIKASLDGMVDAGVIADDSDRVLVVITHRIEHVKGVTETRYTFVEEEDPR